MVTEPNQRIGFWLKKIQQSGYRLTIPRKAVVEVVANTEMAMNPAEVYNEARQRCSSLGLVTVYRTLEKLEELNLIQRVHHMDGCHAFFYVAEGHKHLIICTQCNRAEYFEGDDLSELFDRLGNESGYEVDDHWLQLFGVCSDCKRKSN